MSIYSVKIHLLGESPHIWQISIYLTKVYRLDENSHMRQMPIYSEKGHLLSGKPYKNIHLFSRSPFTQWKPHMRWMPIYSAKTYLLGKCSHARRMSVLHGEMAILFNESSTTLQKPSYATNIYLLSKMLAYSIKHDHEHLKSFGKILWYKLANRRNERPLCRPYSSSGVQIVRACLRAYNSCKTWGLARGLSALGQDTRRGVHEQTTLPRDVFIIFANTQQVLDRCPNQIGIGLNFLALCLKKFSANV